MRLDFEYLGLVYELKDFEFIPTGFVFTSRKLVEEHQKSLWPTGEGFRNPVKGWSEGRVVSYQIMSLIPTSQVSEIPGTIREQLRSMHKSSNTIAANHFRACG